MTGSITSTINKGDTMNIEEIVKELERDFDISFYKRDEVYTADINKHERIDIKLSHYRTGDEREGKPFISTSYNNKKTYFCSGSPCDNYSEVKKFVERYCDKSQQVRFF